MVYLERQQDFYHVMKLSRTPIRRKGGFTLVELMVVIAILAALAGMSYGPILDHLNDGDRQVASSNLGQIGKMLLQFKSDYGSYPSDQTAEELQERKPDYNFGELTGDNSNAYLRQILLAQNSSSEKIFFAKLNCAGKSVTKEGDNKVANGRALERGENAMGYVMRHGKEEGSKDGVNDRNSSTPLAICGVYPSGKPHPGDKVAYDNSSFRGHVFVLACDGSVKDYDDLEEDENDEDMATMTQNIFPETTKGKDTSTRHVVLAPEM